MTNVAEQFKQGVGHALESLADGWRELKSRAGGALTRFRADDAQPSAGAADFGPIGLSRWALMAADDIDDDDRVIVRLETPGMRREDIHIDALGTRLTIRGEKRSDREVRSGAYATVQCAYGAFQRDIELPAEVQVDKARATYRDGVLRIELPKAEGARRRHVTVKVH